MATVIARRLVLLVLAATALPASARAQAPQLINYEGRVAVNGVNFKGPGQFKFALVDAAGTTSYWSHDGTSTAGSEPTTSVTLTVTKGRYSVLLGDTTLPNMTSVPASLFTNSEVRLRVWFDDGANGSQLLTPDQRIVAPNHGAPGHARQLRGDGANPPADAWQELGVLSRPPAGRAGHTAVWTGSEMIVWGGSGSLDFNDGGRYNPAVNDWTTMTTVGAIAARSGHHAVWTGTEMIVWGGSHPDGTASSPRELNDGGRYSPATDGWTPIPATGAPSAREGEQVVWTGSAMIVWGGFDGLNYLDTGGRYNPELGSWTALTNAGAPAERAYHTAVWTGSEMLVWGGRNGDATLNSFTDGARYNPSADSWTPMTSTDAPIALASPTAVWTGSEMIVWGLRASGDPFSRLSGGGRYDPRSDSWRDLTATGAPPPRDRPSIVWTGSEMIVWGGNGFNFSSFNDGARYDPVADRWTAMTITDAPYPRGFPSAVWTGSEMIVWGGGRLDGLKGTVRNDGGRYNPTADTWKPVRRTDAPAQRYVHTAVWTGSEMIVWGGSDWSPLPDQGGRYNPAADSWTAVTAIGAPVNRVLHTAVWTGNEMIVWGGVTSTSLNDGSRYNPAVDSWTAVTTHGAPAARSSHTAVWTGREMIVWGGGSNTGGRYNPVADAWAATTTTDAPPAGQGRTAVWTGSEMIVWGGGTADGRRYNPAADRWVTVNPSGAPAVSDQSAVWTGTEMIIWGTGGWDANLNRSMSEGARYDPGTNSWTPVTTTGAPAARRYHTTVWTGREMIIWGGNYGSYPGDRVLGDGARYSPAAGSWTAVTTVGAPHGRLNHTAVWTGSEMLIFGGRNGIPPTNRTPDVLNDLFSYTPGSSDFRILSVVRSGSDLVIRFPTVTNCTYTLWRSDTLTGGTWTDTGLPAVVGTGAILSFAVPATKPASRFFRVQAGP